jgi:hypothetical protein
MPRRWIAINAVLVVLGGTPGFTLAQGGGHWPQLDPHGHVLPPRVDTSPDRGAKMQRPDMRPAGQTPCQAMATDLATLHTHLQVAQASNDLAHTRAVLDAMQRPLTAMQVHMAGCLQGLSPAHRGMGAPAQQP